MIRSVIFGILLWATTFYALWRGGKEERIAALGMFLNAYLTLLVVRPFAARFSNFEAPVMIIDVVLMVVLIGLALRSSKFWPLWLAAMQTLATLAHFAPLLPHIIPWAYGSAVAIWMYPMLVVLLVVVHRAHRKAEGQRQPS